MKITTVVGARPQLIKEGVLQEEIRKHSDIEHIFVHTGQHYDFAMSDVFINQLGLKKPDYFLGINQLSSPSMMSRMIIELEKVFEKHWPDYVIVYGDTDSTLAAALTAKKMNIKVVHIEAGLRQEPKSMPEEINRVLTDHISSILFTSSQLGVHNLNQEGIYKNIYLVGDIMYDLFLEYATHFKLELLSDLNLKENQYILFTLHRNFNVDNKKTLKNILSIMNKVNKTINVVFPIHPRTHKMVQKFELDFLIKDMKIMSPQNYFNLMTLAKYSKKVVTDSGGLQKETYFLGKNALVLMEDTGWRELIERGYNKLIDPNSDFEVEVLSFEKQVENFEIYGSGRTRFSIIDILRKKEE